MGDLKCFSDIIYGSIIMVHSSNNVSWQPPTPKCENMVRGVWLESRDPVNLWALYANSSKTAKVTNSKFGRCVPKDSPDMTTDKSFRYVGVARVT